MTQPVFAPGSTLTVREVLHGQVWLHFPETVVADDGETLATVQHDGCPLTFPEHPFGPCATVSKLGDPVRRRGTTPEALSVAREGMDP